MSLPPGSIPGRENPISAPPSLSSIVSRWHGRQRMDVWEALHMIRLSAKE